MGTKERLAEEQILCDAERVLKDIDELAEQKQLRLEWARTGSKLKRHLTAIGKIIEKGHRWSNEIQYDRHVGQVEKLCSQYWDQRRGRA